jgi:hypothetical protein
MTPRLWPYFLFCALASGGAVHAKPGGDEPPLNNDVLLMNPQGGEYSRFTKAVVPDQDYDVDLTLVRANRDPKWASSAMICLAGEGWKTDACFRFTIPPNSDRIEAYESDGVSTNGVPKKNVIDAEFRVGAPMHLRFRSMAGGIDFSVNGGTPKRFARPGKANDMSITCVSAYCRFWMKQE